MGVQNLMRLCISKFVFASTHWRTGARYGNRRSGSSTIPPITSVLSVLSPTEWGALDESDPPSDLPSLRVRRSVLREEGSDTLPYPVSLPGRYTLIHRSHRWGPRRATIHRRNSRGCSVCVRFPPSPTATNTLCPTLTIWITLPTVMETNVSESFALEGDERSSGGGESDWFTHTVYSYTLQISPAFVQRYGFSKLSCGNAAMF